MGTRERGLSGLVRCAQFICNGKKHFDSVHAFAPAMFLVFFPHSAIPLEVSLSMLTAEIEPNDF